MLRLSGTNADGLSALWKVDLEVVRQLRANLRLSLIFINRQLRGDKAVCQAVTELRANSTNRKQLSKKVVLANIVSFV